MEPKLRFLRKVEPVTESGCWIWVGAAGEGERYGSFRYNGRTVAAHRVSYELFVSAIPQGLEVCHRCDIGLCVNPAHLFVGTHAQNMSDMASKGRASTMRGEKNHKAKLSKEDVSEIRSSQELAHVLALRFGVSKSHIFNVRAGRSWPMGE